MAMLGMWEDVDNTGRESVKCFPNGEAFMRKVRHTCGCVVLYDAYGNDHAPTNLPKKACKACRKARR